jgi:SWI/SNF-related matrix-associated actin-dependent regulator of chromatin subfamily A-like protein 1
MADEFPDYLKEPTNIGYKYGDLYYRKGRFILSGEPVMMEFAKRVFPGAQVGGYRRTGKLSFGRSSREISDLNWMMMRFPLNVHCEEYLRKARDIAVDRWFGLVTGDNLKPTTPPSEFLGKLYPYQEEAVTFMTSNRRVLLGDSMGLGKTWSALGAVAQSKMYPCLVVCQAHVQLQWQRAIGSLFDMGSGYQKSLFDTDFDVSIKRGKVLAPILRGRTSYRIPRLPFSIIHYGLIAWWEEELLANGFKTVIYDEIQELRHSDTKKYSTASLLSGNAEHVYGLSGTPIYGYGSEIWSVTNAVDFNCLGSQEAFGREWCDGYGSKIVKDPKALHGHMVREGLLLRRKYDDVMPDLPKVIRRVQDLEQDDELYEQLIETAKRRADVWLTSSFTEKGRLAREIEGETRQAAGIAKAKYVAEFVASLIEAGEKPLIYAWHHAVHNILRETLARYEPSFITGKQTQIQKDRAIRKFVNGENDVVILSLRSASGIDGLQYRATCCVFAELDWSPAVHGQSETRIARIGVDSTVKEVPAYYCVSRSGFDEIILDVLGVKKGQFLGLMGDEPEDEQEEYVASQRIASRIKLLVEKLTNG